MQARRGLGSRLCWPPKRAATADACSKVSPADTKINTFVATATNSAAVTPAAASWSGERFYWRSQIRHLPSNTTTYLKIRVVRRHCNSKQSCTVTAEFEDTKP